MYSTEKTETSLAKPRLKQNSVKRDEGQGRKNNKSTEKSNSLMANASLAFGLVKKIGLAD